MFETLAGDIRGGGITWKIACEDIADPVRSALSLRLAAAVHRLALCGDAPELAACYPSCGGTSDVAQVGAAFLMTLERDAEVVRAGLAQGVQTNEVERSAALLGGFVHVARTTGLPLRCFEIGASAGLNLRWDRYRYAHGDWAWGSADAAVRFDDNFATVPGIDARPVEIVERGGCDLAPIDPMTTDGRTLLLSFVWPDQKRRIVRLAAACDAARALPVEIEAIDALGWLRARRPAPRAGTATVLFHSVMAQYLGDGRRDVYAAIETLATEATRERPFAHLSFEPHGTNFEIRVRIWPLERDERVLGRATAHGRDVEWFEQR